MQDYSTSEQVEQLLDIWARWALSDNQYALGYSRISNFIQIMENGGNFSKSGIASAPLNHSIAEQVENCLVFLKKEKPVEADALIRYYLCGYRKSLVASKLKISVRMLEVRMKTAKTWLEGCFHAQFRNRSFYI